MSEVSIHSSGSYEFLPGSDAFSLGVRALPGHGIIELRLRHQLPLAEGLRYLKTVIAARGLLPEAIVGLELRSPEAMTAEAFGHFNHRYRQLLTNAGLVSGVGNPVTRTNAVPALDCPSEVVLVAAQVVRPEGLGGDFVLSGVSEVGSDGLAIAPGDETSLGLQSKAAYVSGAIRSRLAALGVHSCNRINAYYAGELPLAGFTSQLPLDEGAEICHYRCSPPLVGLAFEIDCRRLSACERLDD